MPFLLLIIGFVRYEYLDANNGSNFFQNFLSNILLNKCAKELDFRKQIIEYFFKWRGISSLEEEGLYIFSLQNKGISLKNKPHLLKLLLQKYSHKYTEDDILKIFKNCKSTDEMINILLTKKNNRIKLDYHKSSPTVLTLPDDFISPFENRILTVREMARLQSFDDSFIFLGKRTTGGNRRKFEVPQYTQVGNAVPPLLARSIANEIMKALDKI